ncbi:MAG: type II toxin-antitoxin system PemK/MazF family toxin [Actinobacteria bacterium]|nr:type II toxin-antitoxin system PemK/MazF family toxin [Actinomycetota bacterium]MBW3651283.1 type II toxin-antitoxin system PemK/MazF family toxin [Actinomycetota bacterium]
MPPRRGDVWWAELPEKRRPVLVLTRDAAIPVLRTLLVAPVTRRVRGIATEVPLDAEDGMPVECAATMDNVTTIDRSFLTQRITRLGPDRMTRACVALAIATSCR